MNKDNESNEGSAKPEKIILTSKLKDDLILSDSIRDLANTDKLTESSRLEVDRAARLIKIISKMLLICIGLIAAASVALYFTSWY